MIIKSSFKTVALSACICLFISITTFISYASDTTYVYDELDRLTEVHYPDQTFIKYEYDEIGNMKSKSYHGYYNLVASAGSNGAISPASARVFYGNSQQFTLTPDSGYHVSDVLVDGVSQGASSIFTLSNITANHTIQVNFAINSYNVAASAGVGGSVSPASSIINYGGSQTVSITPTVGYHTTDVLVDGASQGVITSYTFSNVASNHTLTANFGINMYPISVIQGIGQITPESATVPHGGSQFFTIFHTSRYQVVAVKVDGVSQGTSSSYTFNNVTAPHTIEATFSLMPCSNPPVRISGTESYFQTLQAAYDAAPDGATIQAQGQLFTENFNANRNISVTIDGGFTCDYLTSPDYTMLQGSQSVTAGSANIRSFKIMK